MMLHGFSRTAVLVALILPSLCVDYPVEWTPDGVREYNSSNPLLVELGDRILYQCPSAGPYEYSNIWIQTHEIQFLQCDCTSVPGEECDPGVDRNGQCIRGAPNPTLTIRSSDLELHSVISFKPGQRYYIASYAPNGTLIGALSDTANGGQCLQGLRMAIEVMEIPTLPATTTTQSVSTVQSTVPTSTQENTETQSTATDPLSYTPGSGSGIGSSTGSSDAVQSSTGNSTVAQSPLRSILDWHIAIIVVLAVLLVALPAAFVIAALVIARVIFQRRGKLAVNPESEDGDGVVIKQNLSAIEVLPGPEKAPYPVGVFNDPLDHV